MKKIYFLAIALFSLIGSIPSTSFATPFSGTGCTFWPTRVIVWFNYFPNTSCYINWSLLDMGTGAYVGGSISTNVTFNTFSTTKQGYLGMCQLTSCSNIWSTTLTGSCATIICHNVEIETINRVGSPWPQWNTGATGATWPMGATGATGATGTFLFSSGAISWYFDTYQASYDLPQWKLTLHLSSPWEISGREPDVEISGTWFYVDSSYQVNDPSDPRIVLTLKNTQFGTGVACGWYNVTVPWSLVQGTMFPNANLNDLTTKFEIFGCDGYKTTAPPVYMLQSQDTPFIPPDQSWSYLALTYKDTTTGATYFDIWSLMYLLVFWSLAIAITYGIFKFLKSIISWKRFF